MIESRLPAPELRPWVRYYYQVRDQNPAQTVLTPVPARSPQILEFMFHRPFRVRRLDRGVTEDARPIALVGSQTFRRVELLQQGSVDAFTIAFEPGGVAALLRVPARELTDADFDGASVLGRRVSEFHERLADIDPFDHRAAAADDVLKTWLPAGLDTCNILRIARHLIAVGGQARITDLADRAGLSVRQLERRFELQVGMGPKRYANILRFETALRLKSAAPHRRWSDIAHDLGYHDQMHMVHDFTRLADASPSAIWNKLDMFVKPELARHEDSPSCA